jgi:hypothetical protein
MDKGEQIGVGGVGVDFTTGAFVNSPWHVPLTVLLAFGAALATHGLAPGFANALGNGNKDLSGRKMLPIVTIAIVDKRMTFRMSTVARERKTDCPEISKIQSRPSSNAANVCCRPGAAKTAVRSPSGAPSPSTTRNDEAGLGAEPPGANPPSRPAGADAASRDLWVDAGGRMMFERRRLSESRANPFSGR